jgi:hypothetical protein
MNTQLWLQQLEHAAEGWTCKMIQSYVGGIIFFLGIAKAIPRSKVLSYFVVGLHQPRQANWRS